MNITTESAKVLTVNHYPGDYLQLRIAAPQCARHIQPGQYLQINDQRWTVMRKFSEWIDCLERSFKSPMESSRVNVTGPLGEAFALESTTPRALLLGGEGGIAPLIFLTDVLRHRRPRSKLMLLLYSQYPFPFRTQPSQIMVSGLPTWVTAAIPLLEDWGIPSRLASPHELPGCFNGNLDELARGWLEVSQGVADVTVYACGPATLLADARRLADAYHLPCQTVTALPACLHLL